MNFLVLKIIQTTNNEKNKIGDVLEKKVRKMNKIYFSIAGFSFLEQAQRTRHLIDGFVCVASGKRNLTHFFTKATFITMKILKT